MVSINNNKIPSSSGNTGKAGGAYGAYGGYSGYASGSNGETCSQTIRAKLKTGEIVTFNKVNETKNKATYQTKYNDKNGYGWLVTLTYDKQSKSMSQTEKLVSSPPPPQNDGYATMKNKYTSTAPYKVKT